MKQSFFNSASEVGVYSGVISGIYASAGWNGNIGGVSALDLAGDGEWEKVLLGDIDRGDLLGDILGVGVGVLLGDGGGIDGAGDGLFALGDSGSFNLLFTWSLFNLLVMVNSSVTFLLSCIALSRSL